MPGIVKPKPPNAFCWYARYIADCRKSEGRPFRSVKAAIQEAAYLWEKLNTEEKNDWKEKARNERHRFRMDPELRTMTPREFVGQACDASMSGLVANSGFWSRHWTETDRQEYADELDLLDKFDTKKRQLDRQNLETNWIWTYANNRDALMAENFLFISVQSSTPIEADSFVPETLAISHFSVKDGIQPFAHFSCGLLPDGDFTAAGRRIRDGNHLGDEDGCQARVPIQAVAKLVFQRAQAENKPPHSPIFFCLADEYEVVYDTLCDFKVRATANIQTDQRRFSVKQLATVEDLAHCLLKWFNIPLPSIVGTLQQHLYFDKMLERCEPRLMTRLCCGAHESDTLIRCPLGVIRLVAMKIKEWIDCRGIPEQDVPLIERPTQRQFDWPVFADQDTASAALEDSDKDMEVGTSALTRRPIELPNTNASGGANFEIGKMEMTRAWLNTQVRMNPNVMAESPSTHGSVAVDTGNEASVEEPSLPDIQTAVGTGTAPRFGRVEKSGGEPSTVPTDFSSTRACILPAIFHRESAARPIAPAIPAQPASDGGGSSALRRLRKLAIEGNRHMFGVGTEMDFQHQLPHGARGIGRGLHLVPAFTENLIAIQKMLAD